MRLFGLAVLFAAVECHPHFVASSYHAPRTTKNDPAMRQVADILRGIIGRLSKSSLISTASKVSGVTITPEVMPVLQQVVAQLKTGTVPQDDAEVAEVVAGLSTAELQKVAATLDATMHSQQ